MNFVQGRSDRIEHEMSTIREVLSRSRPSGLIDFRDRALLSVCYEAACPIEKLLTVSVGDISAIIAARPDGSQSRLTVRNVVNVDNRPHILFDSSSKRLFVWMKKLKSSGYKLRADAKLFPALHSNGQRAFKRSLGRTAASAIFQRYLGRTELKSLGYAGLRRAGVARQLLWGLHPRAVFAVSGYNHIRSIREIANEYGLKIDIDPNNPFKQIAPCSYVLNAAGWSKLITRAIK